MTSRLSRRNLLQALGVTAGSVTLGGALASCDSGGEPEAGGSFSFMSWDTTSESALHRVAVAWAESADVQIDVQSVPGSDYDAKLRTVLSSGAAPHAIRINDDFVRGYYGDGSLLDLNPYLEKDGINPDDFFPVAFDFAVQEDGARAAWPIMTNPGVLYINLDAFEEAGVELPPTEWTSDGWTWDEFLEKAKALTIPGERWGCLITHGTDFETVWPVNNGSDGIYSMDGTRFTLAEDLGIEAVQWGADLALVHEVHPDFATVDAGSATPNWAATQFLNGNIGMMLSLTSTMDYMRRNPSDVRWDIVSPPGRVAHKTVNTMTVLAVPADSPDPELAWEFLKYATEEAAIEIFSESRGFLPVRRDAADFFVADDDSSPQNLPLVPTAVENAVNENFSPYIERARTIYRPVLDEIWSGRQTAADALGAVKAEVEDALAGEA